MKAMVIGISPDYNYPGNFSLWRKNNTYYASNHGGSLVTRSIMKIFNADYISDFSDINRLNKEYDTCFLGLAAHVHSRRDVSVYADLVEKLDMKVVAPSLGLQDYLQSEAGEFKINQSVLRLLSSVSKKSSWIGCRGPYTEKILKRHGFKHVMPVGCPTFFWNMKPDIPIKEKKTYTNPIVVYHRTFMSIAADIIEGLPLLGQDYEEHMMMTDELTGDKELSNMLIPYYDQMPYKEKAIGMLKNQGLFYKKFTDWFACISEHDFVFGPRLHGCIAALIQNIPAVFIPRDLRVGEIVEFFKLPHVDYRDIKGKTIQEIYSLARFDEFHKIYKKRFNNFITFIRENGLKVSADDEVYTDYKPGLEKRSSQGKIITEQTDIFRNKIVRQIALLKSKMERVKKIKKQKNEE